MPSNQWGLAERDDATSTRSAEFDDTEANSHEVNAGESKTIGRALLVLQVARQ